MICAMYAPWFGELPWYKNIFISCCGNSPEILWVIPSDQDAPKNLPSNVLWVSSSSEWKHKLCDFKPWWYEMHTTDTEFIGWCDWDVVHNLSKLSWDFISAKFTAGWMCSPLFIIRRDAIIDCVPIGWDKIRQDPRTCGWEEHKYLPMYESTILQRGLTPDIDLVGKVEYAVHMYGGKHVPELYYSHMKKHCNFFIG